MEHSTKLLEFIILREQHKYRAPQGSAEWKAARPRSLGGSEFATVACLNKYNCIRELISQKVGITKFNGNVNTMWGNIIEELSKMMIVELGGGEEKIGVMEVAGVPGRVPHHWYSPDGILYKPLADLLLLLEFKNAARRVANGSIPTEYMPQVFCGLDAFPMVDHALFVDTTFRRASTHAFSGRDYTFDTRVHGVSRSRAGLGAPTHVSMVGFYVPPSQDVGSAELMARFGSAPRAAGFPDLIDMGACSAETLEAIFEYVVNARKLKCWYAQPAPLSNVLGAKAPPPTFNYTGTSALPRAADAILTPSRIARFMQEFVDEHGERAVGVMPLKVYGMHTVRVKRDEWKEWTRRASARAEREKTSDPHYVPPELNAASFTEAYAATVANIMKTVHTLLELPMESRESALNAVYGGDENGDDGDAEQFEIDDDELAAFVASD